LAEADDSDVTKWRPSVGNEIDEGIVEAEDTVAISCDEEQLNLPNMADDSVSLALTDMEKKPASMKVTQATDAVADEKEDAEADDVDSVPDEDENTMLHESDVCSLSGKAEVSENCGATKLDDTSLEKENPASQDATEMTTLEKENPASQDATEMTNLTLNDEAVFTPSADAILESTPNVFVFQSDGGNLSKEKDEVESDILSESADGVCECNTDDNIIDRTLSQGEERKLSVNQKESALDDDDDDVLERDSVSIKGDNDVGKSVREVTQHFVDEFISPLFDKEHISSDDIFNELMKMEHGSSVQESEICAVSECVTLEDVDKNVQCSVESACLALEDDIAASINEFLTVSSVSEKVGVSELHDKDVSDDAGLLSADVVKPVVVQLLQQVDEHSSETCEVDHSSQDQEVTEKVVMPLDKDLESSASGSTLSCNSCDLAKESGSVVCARESSAPAGCDDVQKEYGALSIEAETESAKHQSCLSSGNQDDVPPATDYDQVSESIMEELDDDAAENLLQACEAVAVVADNDDEDFEIDML